MSLEVVTAITQTIVTGHKTGIVVLLKRDIKKVNSIREGYLEIETKHTF